MPEHRPARVAQALALAHRLEAAVERGEYRDRAEIARQLGFTRARVTQILDLLLLAPDIQEEIARFLRRSMATLGLAALPLAQANRRVAFPSR